MSFNALSVVPRVGRPADRQDLIVQEIREQIIAGELLPGNRLPTREEIGIKYGAGTNTVQRALDRLRLDGFIKSSGRHGTHVSSEPPHLTQCGIVFPTSPRATENWGGFYAAFNNEALRLQNTQERKLKFYYDVNKDPSKDDYQMLLSEVLAHRLGR